VCAEVSTVLRAVAADFFINCCYLETPSNNSIVIPTVPTVLEVEAVPQLYSVGPDWFQYCLICEKFVVCREF
jgi:hypothetical protein